MFNSAIIKRKAIHEGADICGVAPLFRFGDAPKGFHPCDIYPDCKSVVVFASHFSLSTLQAITNSLYTFVRNIMVEKLDLISFHLSMNWKKMALHQFPSLPLTPMIIGIQSEIMEGVYFH